MPEASPPLPSTPVVAGATCRTEASHSAEGKENNRDGPSRCDRRGLPELASPEPPAPIRRTTPQNHPCCGLLAHTGGGAREVRASPCREDREPGMAVRDRVNAP